MAMRILFTLNDIEEPHYVKHRRGGVDLAIQTRMTRFRSSPSYLLRELWLRGGLH